MSSGCRQEDCTVAETGVCLLNNEPTACQFRTAEADESSPVEATLQPPHPDRTADVDESSQAEATVEPPAPLTEPEKNPRFPPSLSLTLAQTRQIMSGRYCHLVGILGAPDAGKTAALVSLYLLAARGKLKGFTYADSRSLMAFVSISHGARRWNEGQPPEQLTVHTEQADDRSAGFLHLRLRPANHQLPVDLLLPDLPGEWTTALVDTNRVDRLEFLKRADVVWLMVDGQQLCATSTRHLALHRTKLLIQRLARHLVSLPPVVLVVTRRDRGTPDQATLDELKTEARDRGLDLEVVSIASFADAGAVTPGEGIADLIATSTRSVSKTPALWPEASDLTVGERAIMRFRMSEAS